MEGTKLMFVAEKQKAYGVRRTYKSEFYKVTIWNIGEQNQDRILRIDVTPLDESLPLEVRAVNKDGSQKPFAYIDTDLVNINYHNIDVYIRKMQISKETIREIETILNEEYPDFCLLTTSG